MRRRETWNFEVVAALSEMYEDREQERKQRQVSEEEKAALQQMEENVGARVDKLMKHVVPTETGFIWNGENTLFFDPTLFKDGWRDTLSQECQEARAVERLFIHRLGYAGDTHFISSSPDGLSVQWEGNVFKNKREYFVREI